MNRTNFQNKSKATEIQLFNGSQVPKVQTLYRSLQTYDTRGTDECTSAAHDSDTTNAHSVFIVNQKPDQNRKKLSKAIGYLSASNLAHFDRMLIEQDQRKRELKRQTKLQQRQMQVSQRQMITSSSADGTGTQLPSSLQGNMLVNTKLTPEKNCSQIYKKFRATRREL